MNSRFLKDLSAKPDRYPRNLDARYPRILEKVSQLWGTSQIDSYFQDLLLDSRGGRQGFAPEIMQELMFLQSLHMEAQSRQEAAADPWGDESVRKGLEQAEKADPQVLLDRAVRDGNELAVKRLIDSHIDVSLRNANGWTPLMVASFMGNRRVAVMLVEAGADVNAQDGRGYAPLHWASLKNYHEVVQLLLGRGAFVSIRSTSGLTPLLQAAACGGLQTLRLLLRFGAEVDDADNEGWTPLHKALANNHVKAAEMLIDAGADWHARHKSGVTPADLARRKPELAPLLRASG